jgi:hypothetical protein
VVTNCLKALMCIVVLSFAGSLAFAQTAQAPKENKPASDPLKSLARDYDKMRGIAWYRSSSSPKHVNSNGFYLYFGKEDSGRVLPMRLVVRYYADDWLFVKNAWAKVDGVNAELPQESKRLMGWERDNAGGKIWEWSDAELSTPASIATARAISNAKNVTVRFEGRQYHSDRTITAQQLKAMRDVIAAYEAATGRTLK